MAYTSCQNIFDSCCGFWLTNVGLGDGPVRAQGQSSALKYSSQVTHTVSALPTRVDHEGTLLVKSL